MIPVTKTAAFVTFAVAAAARSQVLSTTTPGRVGSRSRTLKLIPTCVAAGPRRARQRGLNHVVDELLQDASTFLIFFVLRQALIRDFHDW
jgi:hypothetical protein